ncbi:pyruvate formate lyase-activating protein [Corynebacterium atypicum]|uniref:Pyruvate formate-lyase-activating enzyme n=1 Tax=Corynebacterium atypicum TaxID=191610 RepID=A0ABM5QMZ6_9CORY|nr:pyruvate formate-lyase-activating protein [Corynebacterium atypicum]AIG64153.1 pyruvate formate lyase-activating protein [Corynebacterium atypicum]
MANDGVSGIVTLEPEEGERVRGAAAGLGVGLELPDDEYSRAQLLEARRTGEVALVHSWELVTAVDGPGTRLTVFLSGCPLRCLYCHNPDTMQMRTGTLEKIDDVVRKVKRYKRVFKSSGGGLTISGGEPLFQIAFTRRLLKEVHDAGIHTCVDTSGFLGRNLRDEDLENIDQFLLDVKSGDPDIYRKVTGRELAPTIEFGDRISKLNKKVWVRFVLVPGFTDDPDNVSKAADIVARWPNVERVEVLPFHNMGADKWHELNMRYTLDDTKPPSDELLNQTRDIFRSRGLQVF